jgi:circadian clock protein KaiC
VVVDPITNFLKAGIRKEVDFMLMRLIDFFKSQHITAVLTSVTDGAGADEDESGISSLIDTWLQVRDTEMGGERNRGLYIVKSRGMAHSNQVREFLLTAHGVELRDVYVGLDGVLTGSMRLAQEAREQAASLSRLEGIERRRRELEGKRQALEMEIAAQRGRFDAEEEELRILVAQEESAVQRVRRSEVEMARSRKADERTMASGKRSRRSPSQRAAR